LPKNLPLIIKAYSDTLLSEDATTIKDVELFKKFEVIQDMNNEDKSIVLRFLDLTIRDYKTKQAYK
jgi:hypothetical protein